MPHTLSSPELWLRYMPAVLHQRQELRLVENTWDHLALLSSLSLLSTKASAGGDLARARHDFAALSTDLMRGLAGEALKNRLDDLQARAQICIDVLVRNLFERTADVGFFATDGEVAAYLGDAAPEHRPAMEARLREYASKYTVYSNIYLFDTAGLLCACLHPVEAGSADACRQDQRFLRSVLDSQDAYVEHHAVHGFSGVAERTLVYARAVAAGGRTVGVLCLEFKLADEMAAIFRSAREEGTAQAGPGRDAVLALVDRQGRVLLSSDPLQLPHDWRLEEAAAQGVRPVRHGGRRYLMSVCDTQGFQGYVGPGWRGLALLPLDTAFDEDGEGNDGAPRTALAAELSGHADLLSQELRAIPARSAAIQSALERSVWNGLLELNQLGASSHDVAPRELLFAKTLLSEIGSTARKTAQAFAAALQDLYGVVMRSLLRDADSRSSLAMQILDRNLYERANDCRWWALTPQFSRSLARGQGGCEQATAVLAEINALYTVYACLVLFDRRGCVVAVSRPDQAHHVGTVLDEAWVAQCLRLQDSQAYVVSPYETSRFYGPSPTFVYAAAVRETEGAGTGSVLGGIGIVWDAANQMQSILADCAVGIAAADRLAFVDGQGRCVCTVGAGADALVPAAWSASAQGRHAVSAGGHLYGIGRSGGQGYREFRTSDGYDHGLGCLVLRHLCEERAGADAAQPLNAHTPLAHVDAAHRVQMATFLVGRHWLGVDARHVVAAAPDVAVLGAGSFSPPFLGLAQIGPRVCSVVDLRSMVMDTAGRAVPSRAADPQRQMVVIRVAPEGGAPREFAMRVDVLGPMLELDRRELQSVGMQGRTAGTSLIDAVAALPVAGGGSGKGMLCRIGDPWLQQCAQGALDDQIPQDMDALLAAA